LALKPKPATERSTDKGSIQKAYAEGFEAGCERYGMAFQSAIAAIVAKVVREIGEWPSEGIIAIAMPYCPN